MSTMAYTVTAILPDVGIREAYVGWLHGGHLRAVLDGGAEEARVVVVEEPVAPIRVETRYVFASREALERYLRDVAPVLRAEGVSLFGSRGVRFERSIGVLS